MATPDLPAQDAATSRNTVRTARRRAGWLILIAVLAGVAAFVVAAGLGWLLGASFATAAGYAVALWVALVASGGALLMLRERRPARRVTLLTLVVVVAAVLFCAVPAGTFATFAVDHSPTGEANPGAAVNSYFLSGPMGGFGGLGRAEDNIDFDRVLCSSRRDQLHQQAAAFARDLDRPGVLRIEPLAGDQVTVHGETATVVSRIQVSATGGTPGSTLTYHSNPVAWTFQTVNDDGWRVCRVSAPAICGSLLRCDSTPDSTTPPSPSVSPSDDLLGGVREMLPCGPRDPFRDMRPAGECPSSSSAAPSPSAS